MKVKFVNDPDPVHIMQILADLMSDESGGEYIYEVCKDGKPLNEKESDETEKNREREEEMGRV